jgi:hypothetical protein
MAQELEDVLGGQYSMLSQDFQLPLIRLILINRMASGAIPNLPKQDVHPIITAGLDALGRTHEQNRITAWLMDCANTLGPESVKARIDPEGYMKRSASNYGVDTEGLMLPEEQVQRDMQAAMLNQMGATIAPNIVKGVSDYAKEGLKQSTLTPPPPINP